MNVGELTSLARFRLGLYLYQQSCLLWAQG